MPLRILMLSAFLIVSCAYNPEKPGWLNRPAVEGKVELLPDPDLHAILKIARHRLDSLFIFVSIRRVNVIDANNVEVFFRKAGDTSWSLLKFERIGEEWRITHEKIQRSEMRLTQPDVSPRYP